LLDWQSTTWTSPRDLNCFICFSCLGTTWTMNLLPFYVAGIISVSLHPYLISSSGGSSWHFTWVCFERPSSKSSPLSSWGYWHAQPYLSKKLLIKMNIHIQNN
jgi:hypothetical protein